MKTCLGISDLKTTFALVPDVAERNVRYATNGHTLSPLRARSHPSHVLHSTNMVEPHSARSLPRTFHQRNRSLRNGQCVGSEMEFTELWQRFVDVSVCQAQLQLSGGVEAVDWIECGRGRAKIVGIGEGERKERNLALGLKAFYQPTLTLFYFCQFVTITLYGALSTLLYLVVLDYHAFANEQGLPFSSLRRGFRRQLTCSLDHVHCAPEMDA